MVRTALSSTISNMSAAKSKGLMLLNPGVPKPATADRKGRMSLSSVVSELAAAKRKVSALEEQLVPAVSDVTATRSVDTLQARLVLARAAVANYKEMLVWEVSLPCQRAAKKLRKPEIRRGSLPPPPGTSVGLLRARVLECADADREVLPKTQRLMPSSTSAVGSEILAKTMSRKRGAETLSPAPTQDRVANRCVKRWPYARTRPDGVCVACWFRFCYPGRPGGPSHARDSTCTTMNSDVHAKMESELPRLASLRGSEMPTETMTADTSSSSAQDRVPKRSCKRWPYQRTRPAGVCAACWFRLCYPGRNGGPVHARDSTCTKSNSDVVAKMKASLPSSFPSALESQAVATAVSTGTSPSLPQDFGNPARSTSADGSPSHPKTCVARRRDKRWPYPGPRPVGVCRACWFRFCYPGRSGGPIHARDSTCTKINSEVLAKMQSSRWLPSVAQDFEGLRETMAAATSPSPTQDREFPGTKINAETSASSPQHCEAFAETSVETSCAVPHESEVVTESMSVETPVPSPQSSETLAKAMSVETTSALSQGRDVLADSTSAETASASARGSEMPGTIMSAETSLASP